jgi:molybdate-binding protein
LTLDCLQVITDDSDGVDFVTGMAVKSGNHFPVRATQVVLTGGIAAGFCRLVCICAEGQLITGITASRTRRLFVIAPIIPPTRRKTETICTRRSIAHREDLLVPAGNPNDISELADLVDTDVRFVNRNRQSGLRSSFDAALGELATEQEIDRATLEAGIAGYDMTARAYESPPRRVLAGKADVALGLRATAETLDLPFVSLGHQQIQVLASPDRVDKSAVQRLTGLLPPAKGDDDLAEIDSL